MEDCTMTHLSIFVAAAVLTELLQDFEELTVGVGFVGEAHLDLVDKLNGPIELHGLAGRPTIVRRAIVMRRRWHLRCGR
jgi:hypothetical protein